MIEKMIILLTTLLLMACCEQQPPIPDPPDNPKDTIFELIWESRLDPDKSIVGSNYVQIWDNYFLCTGDNIDPPTIKAFNKLTGKKEWDYLHQGSLKAKILRNKVVENLYIGSTNDGIFGFDLNERKMKWEINLSDLNFINGFGLTINDEHVYYTAVRNHGYVEFATAVVMRINYLTGEREELFEVKGFNSLMPSGSPVVFWKNPENNHTVLFFNVSFWNSSTTPQDSPQKLYAFDVETKTLMWQTDNYCNGTTNIIIPPVIYKNNVITGGDWSIYSFDARTGKLNWKTEFPEQKPFGIWNTAQHLVVDDRVYVNDDGWSIWCLNSNTGEVIWKNPTDASNCTPATIYYKDMLVYTSWGKGSIMVLDAFTGKKIHQEQSHNYSTFYTDVIYDPDTDMFFTKDYLYAYGFKIRKPK